MKRKTQREGLTDIESAIRAAAELCDNDTADRLIGQDDETFKILVQGVNAQNQLFRELCARTLKVNIAKFDMLFAKYQVVLYKILQNAYAKGIERGKL